jgi:hypothetical protein
MSGAMDKSDAEYDHDRYRTLLAEATDGKKRLALIELLIREKARDRLAGQMLHARLSDLGLKAEAPGAQTVFAPFQQHFQRRLG